MKAQPRFSEAKTTQVAAFFLNLRGGRMHYLKLLKLMYIADREALHRWGVPITMDQYVSMDHGPVPSRAYRLIVDDIPKPNWRQTIAAPTGEYEVELIGTPQADLLSRAEETLMREVFERWGHVSRWRIVDYVHTFPEWRAPQGGSISISLREVLAAAGQSPEAIQAALAELNAEAVAEQALSREL